MSEETANTVPTPELPNIEYIRLTNEMNIVGSVNRVFRDGRLFIKIYRPMQIAVEYIPEQHASALLFYPWLPVSSVDTQEVEIDECHILFHIPLSKQVLPHVTKYMEKTYSLERKIKGEISDVDVVTKNNTDVRPQEANNVFDALNFLGFDAPPKKPS